MNHPIQPDRPVLHRNPAAVAPPQDAPPMVEASFDQNNPVLQAKVAEFIASASGESATPTKRVEVRPNDDFNMPNPNDTMLSEALIDPQKIPITDEEKTLYVKAVLNDEPVRLTITLLNGQFKVQLRSRSSFEQRRIFDVIEQDIRDKILSKEDLAYTVTRMQQYCMALMVERVNGEVFSECKIPYGTSVKDSQKILHDAIAAKIENVTGIRWTNIQNAMRIFENKCAVMGTEAANQDFWTPRG